MAVSNDAKVRVTHIEIRRVQNGFVVMGLDMVNDHYMDPTDSRRVSYVADSPEALGRLIESLATDCAEFVWTPSIDVPMTTMSKRVSQEIERKAQARAEELMKGQIWVDQNSIAPNGIAQYAVEPGKIYPVKGRP